MKQQERVRLLRAQGICDRCHKKQAIPGKTKCPTCDTWIKEYNKIWHRRVRLPRLTGTQIDPTPIVVPSPGIVSTAPVKRPEKPEVVMVEIKPVVAKPTQPQMSATPQSTKKLDDLVSDPRWRGLFLPPQK